MKIKIEINKDELKQLVHEEIKRKLGEVEFNETAVMIETRSTQNYKSEWENADFRASITINA